eukprot:TRINITY_DN11626_c0_g2_i1.p1 TRINITY_DN11626_c0_g2~~TRINITY_DN11626_c0_g2_i1.p1  ORF type:complete len:2770 (+),score=666.63 TRINITY_DN11626_c0_g2_i1:33-8342(+)
MAFQGGAPELRFGDRLCFENVHTEGHLGASFTNGVCFPVVTIHPQGLVDQPTPIAFERCIFAIKRSHVDEYSSPHDEGSTITYGRCVKLVNVTSQQQLSVSSSKAQARGRTAPPGVLSDEEEEDYEDDLYAQPAVSLTVHREGKETLEDTFRILPRGKIREEGESVRAGEQVVLESVAVPGCLLSVGGRYPSCSFFGHRHINEKSPERALELVPTLSGPEAVWVIDTFDTQREIDAYILNSSAPSAPPLTAGSAITLLHKETDAYLEGLPLLAADEDTDEVYFNKCKPRAGQTGRDPSFTSNAIWIVESHEIIRGGVLLAGGYARDYHYRLRHLASGRYLCAYKRADTLRRGTPKLKLAESLLELETETELSSADGSLITFYPFDDAEEVIGETTYARVELTISGTWLHCSGSDHFSKLMPSCFDDIPDTNRRSMKADEQRLRAGLVTKVIYEDLFCIQQVDWSTVCSVRRVVSIVPLLREAADRLATKQTFEFWDEVLQLTGDRSRTNSPRPLQARDRSKGSLTPGDKVQGNSSTRSSSPRVCREDTARLLNAVNSVLTEQTQAERPQHSPRTKESIEQFTFCKSEDISDGDNTSSASTSTSPSAPCSPVRVNSKPISFGGSKTPETCSPCGSVPITRVSSTHTARRTSRSLFWLKKTGHKLGIVCTGNLISQVTAGGEAEKAGMRTGMRILFINGVEVKDDSDDVVAAFEAAPKAFDVQIADDSDTDDSAEFMQARTPSHVIPIPIPIPQKTPFLTPLGFQPTGSGSPGRRRSAQMNVSFSSFAAAQTSSRTSLKKNTPKVKWNIAASGEDPQYVSREHLRTMRLPPCRTSQSSSKLIKKMVKHLLASSWRSSVRQMLIDTTMALSSLISFVSGVEDSEWAHPKCLYLPTKHRDARVAAAAACRIASRPVSSYQRMLFEQDIHYHIIRLLKVPFTPLQDSDSDDFDKSRSVEHGGLSIADIQEEKYRVLHLIMRLGYKLIRQMVLGSPDMAVRLTYFSNFFWGQSGYRLNTTDTLHAILHDNEPVLRELSDELIEKFVKLVPRFGRSPSYLNLLAACCVCNGHGQFRPQSLISKLLMETKTPTLFPILFRTQLQGGGLWIQLLPSHNREALSPCADPESAEWDQAGSGMFLETAPDNDGRWVSLSEFVTRETAATVKYFERQLHLYAAIATDNEECARIISDRVPRSHILAALDRGKWSEDAVRTGFLELARVLYFHPSSGPETADVPENQAAFIDSIKSLLCRDLASSTRLVVPHIQKNRLLCETLRCCMFLIERMFFKPHELESLVPVVCKVIDPTDDILESTSTRDEREKETGLQSSSSEWSNIVRAIEDSLYEVRMPDNRFVPNAENNVIMECKLVGCKILDAIYKMGRPVGAWVEDSLVVASPDGDIVGRRALVKILICCTIYKRHTALFHIAFKILCRCLAEDDGEEQELDDKFSVPSSGQSEHQAVIKFAELLTQDVSQHKEQVMPSSSNNINGLMALSFTRHLIHHFKDNPYDDASSITLLLRVLRRMIFHAKESKNEKGMVAMQNLLDEIGGTELVTTLIEAPVNEEIAHQALLFGIALLEDGNVQVQGRLMEYFDTLHDENFFASLRTRMQRAVAQTKEAQMREKRRIMENTAQPPTPRLLQTTDNEKENKPFYLETNLWHVKDTLRLLQLFCEGHNLPLQNYIHSQPDNLHSMDLVKESILLLKALLVLRVAQMDSYLMEIVLQGFNSLTEYCQGPCKENQNAIVHSHVANEVTTVLSTEYAELTDNRISQEETDLVRNAATITLLALLEGCQDRDPPKTLLKTLDLGLIGMTLDQCWANRKPSQWDGKDSALELGFNLFIFMETMSAFDDVGYLESNKFFMNNEAGFAYFRAMTGRIEISRDANLERVYFRIPEICLNLSTSTRQQVLWSVDRDTPAARISSFFSMADDVLFEMKYSDLHFSERVLREAREQWSRKWSISGLLTIAKVLTNRKIQKLEKALIYIALLSNALLLLCHPYGIFMSSILVILAFFQFVLSLAMVCHHAVAHGPILAHKARNEAENERRSRLHRQLGPQELLQLRDPKPNENKVKAFRAVKTTATEWEARLRQSPTLVSSPLRKDTDSVYADTTVSREYETDPMLDLPILLTTQHGSQYLSPAPLETGKDDKTAKRAGTKWLEVTDDEAPVGSPSKRWQRIRNEVRHVYERHDSVNNSQEIMSANTDHDSGWFDEAEEEEDERKLKRRSLPTKAKRQVVPKRRRRKSMVQAPINVSDSDEQESNWSNTKKSSTPSGLPSPHSTVKSPGKTKRKEIKPLSPWSDQTRSHNTLSPEDGTLRHNKMIKTSTSPGGLGHTPPPSRSGSVMPLQRRASVKPWEKPQASKYIEETEGDQDDSVMLLFSVKCLMNEPAFIMLLLMVISGLLGLSSPFFLTFHLFSIVSNSTVLQSVIRSVTKNGRSLLLTGLLAVIVIYVFSVIGFLFFQTDFEQYGENCTSMLQCFVHILFNGIREGGGIGDLMQAPTSDGRGMDLFYVFRASFDFCFFVIVIVILLNIIFGIIIDTFAELRSEKQKIDEDIKTKCFICGIEASEFERHANGFVHHIKRDHNMWLYIYFIHHLRTKEASEFTGQESNVYDKMKVHDLSFFPTNRAICLSNKVSNNDIESRMPTNSIGTKMGQRQLDIIVEKVVDARTEAKTQSKKIEMVERRIRELGMVMQNEMQALRQITSQLQLHHHQQAMEMESPVQSPVQGVASVRPSRSGIRTASMHENIVDTVPAPLHQRRSRSTTVFNGIKFSRSTHI